MDKTLLLITENDEKDFEIIKEEEMTNGIAKRQIKLRGPYFMSESKNNNNRVYPYELAKKSMDWYIGERVKPMAAYGELDHPDRFDVKMEHAAHCVTSLTENNKIWMGESIVLTGFPCGDMVSALINHGLKFGISSRGAGKLNESGSMVSEYYISCFDIVPNPSIARFVDGILESKEFMINSHGIIVESTFNRLESSIKHLPRATSDRKAHIKKAVGEFFRQLKNV